MKKQIEIRIHPDGKIDTVTRNIKGKACLKYIAVLEQLLEAQTVDSEFTSEYCEEEIIEQNDNQLHLTINQ